VPAQFIVIPGLALQIAQILNFKTYSINNVKPVNKDEFYWQTES
jgi:hypothetical protein